MSIGTGSGSSRAILDMREMLQLGYDVRTVMMRSLAPGDPARPSFLSRVLRSTFPMPDQLLGHCEDPSTLVTALAGMRAAVVEFTYGGLFLLRAGPLPCPVIVRDHEVLARRFAHEVRDQPGALRRAEALSRLAVAWIASWAVYLRADRIVALTEEDARFIRRWFPGASGRTVAIPVSFHAAETRAVPSGKTERSVLFAGNFHHRPNLEALLWFLAGCGPHIEPPITVHVVGLAEPLAHVRLPEGRHRVVLHGHVEQLGAAFAEVAVAVSPVISGTGIRIKNLLFASLGKAIVTTPLGNEGIGFSDGREALIAAGPAEFARAVSRLLDDRDLAGTLGAAARTRLINDFNHAARFRQYQALVFSQEHSSR
jgi:glycosyltransferase involved in cell wall biosynthesis